MPVLVGGRLKQTKPKRDKAHAAGSKKIYGGGRDSGEETKNFPEGQSPVECALDGVPIPLSSNCFSVIPWDNPSNSFLFNQESDLIKQGRMEMQEV